MSARHARSAASKAETPPVALVSTPKTVPDAASSPPAEFLTSPFSLFNVDELVGFGATLACCLLVQALLSQGFAQLSIMGPVAQISRDMQDTSSLVTLMSWKIAEVTIGWFAGFNALEMALFTFVTNFPHFYFLWTFYSIDILPLALMLGLNTVSSLAGFSYSRFSAGDISVVTGFGQDPVLWVATRLLSAALYAVPMLLSLNTWLPVHLAIYWEDIKTLSPARSTTILGLAPVFFLLGHCTVGLILNPVIHRQVQPQEEAPSSEWAEFDPARASLLEHVKYNLDGLRIWKHIRPAAWFLTKRTAVLALWATANAAFNACATVEGCDTSSPSWFKGPAFWGTVWGAGAAASGVGMGWVGGIL